MNETILECPDFNEETNELLKNVSFWVEGFLSCVFAIIGILAQFPSMVNRHRNVSNRIQILVQRIIGQVNKYNILIDFCRCTPKCVAYVDPIGPDSVPGGPTFYVHIYIRFIQISKPYLD